MICVSIGRGRHRHVLAEHKHLVEEGVPPNRLAATGFGEFQPLDGTETPPSYARNRRIELRLTDR